MSVDWLIVQQNNASSVWNLHDPNADIKGSFKMASASNSSSFTIGVNDAPIQYVNNTAGTAVVTLANVASAVDTMFWIKNTNASTQVTISGTIDNNAAGMQLDGGEAITIHSDGSSWQIL